MSNLEERLRRYVDDSAQPVSASDALIRARSRARRSSQRHWLVGAASTFAVLISIAIGIAITSDGSNDRHPGTIQTPSSIPTALGPAQLASPRRVVSSSDGSVYIADPGAERIFKWSRMSGLLTYAGSGSPGFAGDGDAAVRAKLREPTGVAIDRSGALLIADAGNNRVRRVGSNGTIETIAGSGNRGYNGDGGRADRASLNDPSDVAVDQRTGRIYITDFANSRVRAIDQHGIITTFAGNGRLSPSDDGVVATQSAFGSPMSIATAPDGSVYVGLFDSKSVRRVGPDGHVQNLGQVGKPEGITVDQSGTLYVVDDGNDAVNQVGTNGQVSQVFGKVLFPQFAAAKLVKTNLDFPNDLVVDGTGSFLLVQADGLIQMDTNGNLSTLASARTTPAHPSRI